jgi:hypothetical protein
LEGDSSKAVEQWTNSVYLAGKLCPGYLLSHIALHGERAIEAEGVTRVKRQPRFRVSMHSWLKARSEGCGI